MFIGHTENKMRFCTTNTENNGNELKNGVIKGGSLSLVNQDQKQTLVEEKTQGFKKRAQQIIGNALKNREKKLAGLREMQAYCKTLEMECEEARNGLTQLNDRRSELMQTYGISADSEEEKELRYIEGVILVGQGENDLEGNITEDFTDYQKQAFEIDKMSKIYSDNLKMKQGELHKYQMAVTAFKIDDVKDQTMRYANQEAEAVLKEGNKAIINQIVQEAVEEGKEEIKEGTKEIEGERESSSQEIEITKETMGDGVQQQLLQMVEKEHVHSEDIKGIKIDSQI